MIFSRQNGSRQGGTKPIILPVRNLDDESSVQHFADFGASHRLCSTLQLSARVLPREKSLTLIADREKCFYEEEGVPGEL